MIQNLLQQAVDFFESREPREQILLIIGVPIIMLLVFYMLAINPSLKNHDALLVSLNNETKFNLWFKRHQTLLNQHNKQAFDWKNQSLPSMTEASINQSGLNTWQKSIFQNRNAQMVVTFNRVPYSKLSAWISNLQSQYQVKIIDASLKATKQKGVIDAKIVLSKPDNSNTSN